MELICGYFFRNSNLENRLIQRYDRFIESVSIKTKEHRELAKKVIPKSIELILTQENLKTLNEQITQATRVSQGMLMV